MSGSFTGPGSAPYQRRGRRVQVRGLSVEEHPEVERVAPFRLLPRVRLPSPPKRKLNRGGGAHSNSGGVRPLWRIISEKVGSFKWRERRHPSFILEDNLLNSVLAEGWLSGLMGDNRVYFFGFINNQQEVGVIKKTLPTNLYKEATRRNGRRGVGAEDDDLLVFNLSRLDIG